MHTTQQLVRTEHPSGSRFNTALACTPPTLMFMHSLFFACNNYTLERSYPLQDHPSVIAEFSFLLFSALMIPATQLSYLVSSTNQSEDDTSLAGLNKNELTIKKLKIHKKDYEWAETTDTSESSGSCCKLKLDVKKFGVPGFMSMGAYVFFLLFTGLRCTEMFSNITSGDNQTADSSQANPLSIPEIISIVIGLAIFFGATCLRLSSSTNTKEDDGAHQDITYGTLEDDTHRDSNPTDPNALSSQSSTSTFSQVSLTGSIVDTTSPTTNRPISTPQPKESKHQLPTSSFSTRSLAIDDASTDNQTTSENITSDGLDDLLEQLGNEIEEVEELKKLEEVNTDSI